MKALVRHFVPFLSTAVAGVLLAGCNLISTRSFSEARFYETREVTVDKRVAHQVCRQALERMGFVHFRGSPGSGELEMVTRVQPGSTAQLVRQRRALVAVAPGDMGETLVKIGFWEESEAGSPVDSTSVAGRLLRGGTLYDAFWQHFVAIANADAAAGGAAPAEGIPATPSPAPGG